MLPIPATFVVAPDGYVNARFIDPDFRRRMAVEELLEALRSAVPLESRLIKLVRAARPVCGAQHLHDQLAATGER